MTFTIVVVLTCVTGLSGWLTGRFLKYALARGLLDVPNARSSHSQATARGGGVAIVISVIAGFAALACANIMPWRVAAALSVGGALVAMVGFADDRGHIAPLPRLAGHFAGALCILALLPGLPVVHMLGRDFQPGAVSYVFAALYLVWLLNLTNFMDGIDGIAGTEVITVCIGAMASAWLTGSPPVELWAAPTLVVCATLGFLWWNWPPAKIFMGDAGSGFLGLIVAALSLRAAIIDPRLLWCWLIVLGVFIVDATVTLLRRIMRRQKFYQAHRSHAYQHAASQCGSHKRVTVVVGLINLGWLLPMASVVASGRLDGASALAIAYLPLVCLALWFRAGRD